jgi:predicted aconitase with swiveling domain
VAEGIALVGGSARGAVTVLTAPLGLWGGFDPATGVVTDPHHPQHGATLTGRVVAMPSGRGSSSTSSVLAEAIRLGTAPSAIVLLEPDAILALGAIVARELYGAVVPVVVVDRVRYAALRDDRPVVLDATPEGVSILPA